MVPKYKPILKMKTLYKFNNNNHLNIQKEIQAKDPVHKLKESNQLNNKLRYKLILLIPVLITPIKHHHHTLFLIT